LIRQLDRLIIKELIGPWLFGVGLFSALLMAATYLGRLVGYIVDQAPGNLVAQLVFLLLPAILVKTFTMAVLLAALLAFGRLSSDSEIVALRAGGASIYRIVTPVAVFSLLIALVTFWFDEQVVPSATAKSLAVMREIVSKKGIKGDQAIARPYVSDGKLQAFINARNFNVASQSFQGVTLLTYDKKGDLAWILQAKEMQFDPSNPAQKWRIEGGGELVSADFTQFVHVNEAWPRQIRAIDNTFAELTAERKDEFEAMSMMELKDAIEKHRAKRDWMASEIANAEYGYWNKIATPMASFVFGVLGAVLGIRNHRTGTATGFALAIAIIFGYLTLINVMNVWAQGGFIPAYAASFAPITVGFIASWIIMWRRNA